MSNDGVEIAPAQVPLSHKQSGGTDSTNTRSKGRQERSLGAPLALTALALAAFSFLWWISNRSSGELQQTGAPVARTAVDPAPTNAIEPSKQLAPFAQTQQALARERAQASLAKFVEQQIQLEESMSVGQWGQGQFDKALSLASTGDERFVDERFEQAQQAYDDSTALLAELIEQGRARVAAAIEAGNQAVAERDETLAMNAFNEALAIDADSEAAQEGLQRALQLPDIKRLLLRARNHELAGQWESAAQDYQSVLAIDPGTAGVKQALQRAEEAVGGDRVKQTLSDGFRALEEKRYSAAKAAFNKALAMDRGNEIALGGLQQVNARTELTRIAGLQRTAEQAVQREDWTAAVQAYESALRLDANIQFAKAGIANAKAQQRAATLLGNIVADPNKLSSAELLEQGRQALTNARSLAPQGPKLTALIQKSDQLLRAYAQPVAVQLTSDNQTEVLVSTIGKLGAFDSRELSLRPGEYVLLGSRNGCRDVRRTVIVAPGMGPVDIRCVEELKR